MKFNFNDIKFKIAAFALATAVMIGLLLYCIGFTVAHGPSNEVKYNFISKLESSALTRFITGIYFSDKAREEIISAHEALNGTRLDTSNLNMLDSEAIISGKQDYTDEESDFSSEGVEVISIEKDTFRVKLMIVSDPKRVFVGTPKGGYGVENAGDSVYGIMKSSGAIAGISAGGMAGGTGGIPDGVVISNGNLMWGSNTSSYQVAGIDGFGVLHVGKMKLEEITGRGITNAASFGPALIIDGEPQLLMESMPTARTAIGQRADGAILLLTVTPINVGTTGATYNDLIEIFTEYHAINAANLYCQSEPTMIFGEKNIASGSLATDTPVAAAFLVK